MAEITIETMTACECVRKEEHGKRSWLVDCECIEAIRKLWKVVFVWLRFPVVDSRVICWLRLVIRVAVD